MSVVEQLRADGIVTVAEWDAIRANAAIEIERLRGIIQRQAQQKLPAELDEAQRESADYEGAYVILIENARNALAESQ